MSRSHVTIFLCPWQKLEGEEREQMRAIRTLFKLRAIQNWPRTHILSHQQVEGLPGETPDRPNKILNPVGLGWSQARWESTVASHSQQPITTIKRLHPGEAIQLHPGEAQGSIKYPPTEASDLLPDLIDIFTRKSFLLLKRCGIPFG